MTRIENYLVTYLYDASTMYIQYKIYQSINDKT